MIYYSMDYKLLKDTIYYFNGNRKNGDQIAAILLDAFYRMSDLVPYEVLIANHLKMASIAVSIADAEGAKCSLIHTAEDFEHTAQMLRERAARIDLPQQANDALPPFLRF